MEKRAFDAWGNIVKLTDGNNNILSNFVILDRGFTGHEHLTGVVLIHMNARLYDPKVHRFLAPDNFVQNMFNTQNFNRYGYALNNPLVYIDQDGEFFLVAALLGGIINWITHGAEFSWKGLGYFGVGAAAGALTAGVGSGINVAMAGGSFSAGFMGTAVGVSSTGFIAGAATGAGAGLTNGFVTGLGNTALGGGTFGESLRAGFNSGWKQGLAGGVAGGLFGGIDALVKDVDFFTGKANMDMSNGVGAHGIIDQNKTITGKYVGNYHGTDVYESSAFQEGAGITLPGRGIIVSRGAYSLNADPWLMRHEFGHVLQAETYGYSKFYNKIAPSSLRSAALDPSNHYKFWTEVMANLLSYGFFDYPVDWPSSRFPLRYDNWDWVKFWRKK